MKDQRPININPLRYRYPVTAIVSILHRVSGVITFLLIPLLLWMLGKSLASDMQFQDLQSVFNNNSTLRFFTWVVLSGLLYHLVAGIRHLIMDLGFGESLTAARASGYLVIIIGIILIILAGIWLW